MKFYQVRVKVFIKLLVSEDPLSERGLQPHETVPVVGSSPHGPTFSWHNLCDSIHDVWML